MILPGQVNLSKSRNPKVFGKLFWVKGFPCVPDCFPDTVPFYLTNTTNYICNWKQFNFPYQISDLKILNALYHIKEKEKSIPLIFYTL
jgi:hypothetical protein